jgi:cell fate regulator YaaT (PSP1 superfamily)
MSEISNESKTPSEVETKTEHTVVGVRFKPCGKIYDFEVDGIDVSPGTWVVVESEMGLSLGLVVKPKHKIEKTEQSLKKILRVASEEDIEADRNNRPLEEEAKTFCIKKVKDHNLPMKIVATESTLDRKRLIFYFTADGRIDFRGLVRDLAAKFKTRIEMRQIGVRDEVKFIGGIGVCGRETCCTTFLTSFEPISIRMAKKQELSINQSKLSGICGRLMCCLSYELEDSDEEEVTTSTMQEEVSSVAIGEPSEDEFQSEKLDTICTCHTFVSTEKKEEAPSPPLEEERHLKRHRKTKKRLSRKSYHGKLHLKKSIRTDSDESIQPERKDKGKPFSRRRNFWRKKRH